MDPPPYTSFPGPPVPSSPRMTQPGPSKQSRLAAIPLRTLSTDSFPHLQRSVDLPTSNEGETRLRDINEGEEPEQTSTSRSKAISLLIASSALFLVSQLIILLVADKLNASEHFEFCRLIRAFSKDFAWNLFRLVGLVPVIIFLACFQHRIRALRLQALTAFTCFQFVWLVLNFTNAYVVVYRQKRYKRHL